jgi:hypothetical protein
MNCSVCGTPPIDILQRLPTQPAKSRRRAAAAPLAGSTRDYLTLPAVVKTGSPSAYDPTMKFAELCTSQPLRRLAMRCFTRLANLFSKLENHMHAVSFYFMVYNFLKIHSSIKTAPAMEAGVTTSGAWETSR